MDVSHLIRDAIKQMTIPSYINPQYIEVAATTDVANMVVERVQMSLEQAILGAQSILKSTAEEYINALYITDGLTIGIAATASHLETGYGPREMQDDLLSSPKAKTSKDGTTKYLIVPIGKEKKTDIHNAIRNKTSDLFRKGSLGGASMKSLDEMTKDMRNVISNVSSSKFHKPASEPEFATVSSSQDASESWVHPGFVGLRQLDAINYQLKIDLSEASVVIVKQVVDDMRDNYRLSVNPSNASITLKKR